MEISGEIGRAQRRQRLQQRLHLQQDLFAPLLQALFAQIVLADLIERANEVAVGAQRFGAGELSEVTAGSRDELYAQRRDLIVQHAQRVERNHSP